MLTGTRVIDLSTDVAGAFAARLFAVYGADVVKVEPPEGDPTRSLPPFAGDGPEESILFAYLNAGKRSATIDVADAAQRKQLLALLRTADVIIESHAPGELAAAGIDTDALLEERPALVVCSITPFGQDGPRAGWRTTALTAFAAGGQMMICGDPDKPPLKTAGHQSYYQAGLHGFSSSLVALYAARSMGLGDHIDISIQEVQASSLEGHGPTAMVRGGDQTRAGNQARAVWGIYPCADGFVGVAAMARQAPSVYELIGHPELPQDPMFQGMLLTPEANAIASALITEWTMARTAREIYDESGAARAPFSLIPTPDELLQWPPLVEAGFWQTVEHPVIGEYQMPAGPITINGSRGEQRRAPLLGEHTAEVFAALDGTATTAEGSATADGTGSATKPPLDGIRVLDLTQIWAGPFAARFLADMGADVIHIEGPSFPDGVRGIAAMAEDPLAYNKAAYFNEYNRNKRGMALDISHPDGLAAFRRMVENSDVVMENWSSGVAERLGIGYEALKAINPRIVVISMPGFGHEGSEAGRVGFGPSIEQMGGLVAVQGYEGGVPHKSGISYGDPVAGIVTAGAVAMALVAREQSGEGAYAVIAQRDNVIGLVGEYMAAASVGRPLPVRIGNADPLFAPHNVYPTRDGDQRPMMDPRGNPLGEIAETWLAIAVDSDVAWAALRGVIGNALLDSDDYATAQGRQTARDAIDAVIAEWAADREPGEAAEVLQAAGVSASPVLSGYMLVHDDHLAARGFFPTYDHADAGICRTSRPVWRLARRPFDGVRPAPRFGEHNRAVLSELGGLSEAEIDSLNASNVIVDAPIIG